MRKRCRWFLLIYLGLLTASHVVRLFRPPEAPPAPEMSVISLPATGKGADPDATIRLAYYDFPATDPAAPTLLLLHGSPMPAASTYLPVAEHLRGKYRLLIPDLPGYGASTRHLPDHSASAQAQYLVELVRRLGADHVHVVGYSLGGAVALYFAEQAPEATASLTLLSGLGVIEYELFGHHTLNHAVHGAQLGALWFLLEATPHFGLLDHQPLNTAYARSFYQTDQRDLRRLLLSYDGPAAVIHGRQDVLIPFQAAVESVRLLPQASFFALDGGHMIVMAEAPKVAGILDVIVRNVLQGTALTRDRASEIFVTASQEPFERDLSWRYTGLALVIVLILLALATLVTEDLTCIGAGIMAAHGLLPVSAAIGACLIGILVGDLTLYGTGRLLGRRALRWPPLRWIVSDFAVSQAERWFHRRGGLVIIITRFIPGTRAATYFTAGMLRAPFLKFLLFFVVAAAIWTPALVLLAYGLGQRLLTFYDYYAGFALWVSLALIIGLYLLFDFGLPLASWRGRRLLLSRWRRQSRWEFWPLWRVNAPVFLYVLWLGFLRYRRPTLFALCNPGIPYGGYIGESKSQILTALGSAGGAVGQWTLIPPGDPTERANWLEAWRIGHGLSYPLVLKPDEGQRGVGVAFVSDREAALARLAECPYPLIAQEFLPGEEFGVYYARLPDEPSGRVPSVTIKQFTAVVGNGKDSLEKLILQDDRAVSLAPVFLKRMRHRLDEVPPLGEIVRLIDIGTHARGATFLDGRHLISPDLERVIDGFAKGFAGGFYLGRFDIRCPSAGHLQRGQGLRIVELNGLTAEQTHIYDPKLGLLNAWRTLMSSWKLAFDIGAQLVARGHRPPGKREFLRNWWIAHFRQRERRL